MKELKQILIDHAGRYPLMQPRDAVKLIYQNTFGGGHMIRDAQSCMAYLHREYAQTQHDPRHPLREDIGCGFVRVHLAAAESSQIEKLGRAFIDSAAECAGSLDDFLGKLQLLRQMTREHLLPFSAETLEAYLAEYEKAGYPMVSHSEQYRKAYKPAYRVIPGEFLSEE